MFAHLAHVQHICEPVRGNLEAWEIQIDSLMFIIKLRLKEIIKETEDCF